MYYIAQIILIVAWYVVPAMAEAPMWVIFLPTLIPLLIFISALIIAAIFAKE